MSEQSRQKHLSAAEPARQDHALFVSLANAYALSVLKIMVALHGVGLFLSATGAPHYGATFLSGLVATFLWGLFAYLAFVCFWNGARCAGRQWQFIEPRSTHDEVHRRRLGFAASLFNLAGDLLSVCALLAAIASAVLFYFGAADLLP